MLFAQVFSLTPQQQRTPTSCLSALVCPVVLLDLFLTLSLMFFDVCFGNGNYRCKNLRLPEKGSSPTHTLSLLFSGRCKKIEAETCPRLLVLEI